MTVDTKGIHRNGYIGMRNVIMDTEVTLLLWSLLPDITDMQDCKFHIFSIYKVILTHILKSRILTWARKFWAFSLSLRQH